MSSPQHTSSIETVLSCVDLEEMTSFLRDELGFRIETISPADDPTEITVSGLGSRVRLRRTSADVAGHLLIRSERLAAGAPAVRKVAPNGTVIEFVSASTDVVVPDGEPAVSVVRSAPGDAFGIGRAGMGYRDLLPGRWGGRFIASHISIADGGEVADYVHFHRIRFQMIFVAAGWVEVVYEEQGEPFRMYAGDCVLQPPEIRHRVLRSSAGLEVIEIGCPAIHDTIAEHTITLPTSTVDAERDFGGQWFVRHIADDAPTNPSIIDGLVVRDTGIGGATRGLASAHVLSAHGRAPETPQMMEHDGEFVMAVVLAGAATLDIGDGTERSETVQSRDAVAIPAGVGWGWSKWSADFEYLDVSLPARTLGAS